MRLLMVHNHYLQPGGEDAVFEAEKALLERMDHEVIPFVEDNAHLDGMNPLRAALNAVWSREAQDKIRRLIRERKPDVAHFHNTFLMISPAAYYACKEEGVPVVQTLHNYRLFCPSSTHFYRAGGICEICLSKQFAYPGILHGCYRNSRLQTTVLAFTLFVHRLLKTWVEHVDMYIALTEFARRKFVQGGLPEHKIIVKPNFQYKDPDVRENATGEYALFVGRIGQEKGILTLTNAWRQLAEKIPLKIAGDGPLYKYLGVFVTTHNLTHIDILGRRPHDDVLRLMKSAKFLVFPSEWYEGFPMTIVEAFACGLPVVASRLGAMAEIVEDGRTGLLFNPGDPDDLMVKVEWAWNHPEEMAEMGREARREYEEKYTADKNYEMLMQIYRSVYRK